MFFFCLKGNNVEKIVACTNAHESSPSLEFMARSVGCPRVADFIDSPSKVSQKIEPLLLESSISGDDSVFLSENENFVDDEAPQSDCNQACHSSEILESKESLYESIVNNSFGSIELVRLDDPASANSMQQQPDWLMLCKNLGRDKSLLENSFIVSPYSEIAESKRKKRQFNEVEKSPVGRPFLPRTVTGLTMDIQALSVMQPSKRVLRDIQNEIRINNEEAKSSSFSRTSESFVTAGRVNDSGLLIIPSVSQPPNKIDLHHPLKKHIHYMTQPSSSSDEQHSGRSASANSPMSMADYRPHFVVSSLVIGSF